MANRFAFYWPRNTLFAVSLCAIVLAAPSRDTKLESRASAGQGPTVNLSQPDMRPGYLITLESRDGGIRLMSAAEIENYEPTRHLAADDDWRALLFDQRGMNIGRLTIGNPGRFSPIVFPDQTIPMVVKIPRLPGLADALICNERMEVQLHIPVDASFRGEAAAQRRAFLAHENENRRRLLDEARLRRQRPAASLQPAQEMPRLENVPEELQKHYRGETAFEIEQLESFGAEIMNLRHGLRAGPEELARMIRREEPAPAAHAPVGSRRLAAAAPAYTLSGRVTDLESGEPVTQATLLFYQYDGSNVYQGYLGSLTTDQTGFFSMAVDAGRVDIQPVYSSVPGKTYVQVRQSVGISGNTQYDFSAIPGIRLTGMIQNEQGQPAPSVSVRAYSKELQLTVSTTTLSSGLYSTVVPQNRPLNISVIPQVPYTAPPAQVGIIFATDTTLDFRLETGWTVSGTVIGEGGAVIAKASVLLRQLCSTTTGTPSWSTTTDNSGRFKFGVGKRLEPNSFLLAAYAQNYVLQSLSLQIDGDVTQDIQLARGNTLSGLVQDFQQKPLRGVRVRAYQDGTFINSALTLSDGSYGMSLPVGAYTIEALPPSGSLAAPALNIAVPVSEPRTLDIIMPPASGILALTLYFTGEDSFNRFSRTWLARFELYRSGLTAFAGGGTVGPAGFDAGRGKYFRTFILYADRGAYSLTAFLAGCRAIRLPEIEIGERTEMQLDVPELFLWTGTLLDADRTPLPNMYILSYTDLAREYETTTTDASGKFSILMTPEGFVKFYSDANSRNILHTERFGDLTASRTANVVLDEFPSFSDSGETLTQFFGVPDRRSRWNIVMIGDGYTGINEPYADLNGNGRWDGVLFYDLDQNGILDIGERYQAYGTVSAPKTGTNPTLHNEPFQDLNGDQVPNINDQELFYRNTLDTARSLFGQDEWNRHREAFNLFRIRLVSRQAGHKILDSSGEVVLDRDTALGTYLHTPDRNYLFSANYTLVSQYINQYVPECDTRIVMVNQPIRMGRVNSYMFQYGGDISTLNNDYVVAHEMGHNVGLLADEYTEYEETYKGVESAARNITSLTDVNRIPWRHLISPGKEIPSQPGSHGVGLYEGAGYYTGGRYRPTEYCMMVSGNRYCPVCTAEIEIRLSDITGVVADALPESPVAEVHGLYPQFIWAPSPGASHYYLELETADGSQLLAAYDVYDRQFLLPFALTAGTDYRWRLRPATPSRSGNWTPWIYFRPHAEAPAFVGVFAQIATGGAYRTILTGLNIGAAAADVLVSLVKSDGTSFGPLASGVAPPVPFLLNSRGILSLQAVLSGDAISGYARLAGGQQFVGSALIRAMHGDVILSEAATGLRRPARHFTVYVDNSDDADSGYAIANPSDAQATVSLILRDREGVVKDMAAIDLLPGRHIAEFARERFQLHATAGFEGSIEFTSSADLAAVGLRYDNMSRDPAAHVFTTVPVVLTEESRTVLYFPQFADGAGYRTDLVLLNPWASGTLADVEFHRSDGTRVSIPVGGRLQQNIQVSLNGNGVGRLVTDGASEELLTGYVKVTCALPIGGSAIYQTRVGDRIVSEAGVQPAPLTRQFIAYVDSMGSSGSGLAICNPNPEAAVLTLVLRRANGEIAATVGAGVPAWGHVARFFPEWFPLGFGEFEGTVEVFSTTPVGGVGLRFDNPNGNVFAALPVIILP